MSRSSAEPSNRRPATGVRRPRDRKQNAVVPIPTPADSKIEWIRSREPDDKRKLGEYVAGEIEKEIARRGWPVGEVLGAESELTERYQVSRAVLREAVRLLEHHGAAEMRRGPGGGLTVRAPQGSSVSSAAAIFLNYANVTASQLHEARMSLELSAVELATARLDEEGVVSLRESLALEREMIHAGAGERDHAYVHDRLHLEIARLSRNPVFPLYVSVLTKLTYERSVPLMQDSSRDDPLVLHVHSAIVDAIVSGDVGLARHRMQRHLEGLAKWLKEEDA